MIFKYKIRLKADSSEEPYITSHLQNLINLGWSNDFTYKVAVMFTMNKHKDDPSQNTHETLDRLAASG